MLILILVVCKGVLFSISNKTDYLPETLKKLELLYSFEYSDTELSFFHAFRLNKNITGLIKKEGITTYKKIIFCMKNMRFQYIIVNGRQPQSMKAFAHTRDYSMD